MAWICAGCSNSYDVTKRPSRCRACGSRRIRSEAPRSHIDKLVALATVHGGHGTSEYRIWKGMKARCTNQRSPAFKDYGGRGIAVCAEWLHDFAAFARDMGRRPTPRHTLERIDNNGPYAPSNCRWATYQEQANNRRVRYNATGATGVAFHRKTGKYAARVYVGGGQKRYIGLFVTVAEAAAAIAAYGDARSERS